MPDIIVSQGRESRIVPSQTVKPMVWRGRRFSYAEMIELIGNFGINQMPAAIEKEARECLLYFKIMEA